MTLSIDFALAYRQAHSMAQCADEMQQQFGRLNSIITEVRAAWKGPNASAYIKKLEAFGTKLQANAKKCREDAAAFRARIDAIKAAEERAAAAAASLGSPAQ
jgi:uncharacterized protein YukE